MWVIKIFVCLYVCYYFRYNIFVIPLAQINRIPFYNNLMQKAMKSQRLIEDFNNIFTKVACFQLALVLFNPFTKRYSKGQVKVQYSTLVLLANTVHAAQCREDNCYTAHHHLKLYCSLLFIPVFPPGVCSIFL